DLYSLGATFYELLSGKPPFEAANSIGVLLKQTNDRYPSITKRRADLPSGLVHGLDWLLAKDRDARPADPATLLELLHGVADAAGIDADHPPNPHATNGTTIDSPVDSA
ncbi:MAG: hypothetical protein ACYTFG_22435, partial [Planctomycetota bacterium]